MSGSVVKGLVHATQPPPSIWHWTVVVPSPVKVNAGVLLAVTAGASPTAGGSAGGAVSMVHSWRATGPALPAASRRRASSTCVPSARPLRVTGLVQVLQPPPSTRHWNVVSGSPVSVAEIPVFAVMVVGRPAIPGADAGATVSTVQVMLTGVLALPAASSARTFTTCDPLASPESASGLVQGAQLLPSIWHSNVLPDSAGVSVRLAVVWLVGLTGRLSTVGAAGAAVSTVQVLVTTPLTFPAASIARISSVWVPSPSPLAVNGAVHGAQLPESSLHSKVAPGSPDMFTLTLVALVAPDGAPDTDGSPGAAVSTVMVRVSGVPPLPAWSTVRTSNTCGPSARRDEVNGLVHALNGSPSIWHS